MLLRADGRYQAWESCGVKTENPLAKNSFGESMVTDLKARNLKAIYTEMRAIHGDRLTKNFTLYSREELRGRSGAEEPTGYASWVHPYGKPVIREHNLQGDMLLSADVPMGRIIHSTYVNTPKGTIPEPAEKGRPGYKMGNGYVKFICAITEPEAIERVLTGIYHTVSIGSTVEKVIESISGIDLIDAYKNDKEMPQYTKGMYYDGALSYYIMKGIRGNEVSYVNLPADEIAGVIRPDIGWEAVKLLVAEKSGESAKFYDALTGESATVEEEDYGTWDMSYFNGNPESFDYDKSLWKFPKLQTESVLSPGDKVTWGARISGTVKSIDTENKTASIETVGNVVITQPLEYVKRIEVK